MEQPVEKCTKCGCDMFNGDNCYCICGETLCEECINDSKVILDVEPYTYHDYLSDKYEMERHDDTEN